MPSGSPEAAAVPEAPPPPPPDLSIAEMAHGVRTGELSALELTETYLSRIAAFAEPLNVYRTVTAESARARAAEIDEQVRRGENPGPLAGVPLALKDNIGVGGVPLTAASGFLRDNVATEDAPVTRALHDAGSVLLGKLHMSEWAIGGTTQNVHFGVGRNPWDPQRVPGGSSGGSGAAVAADLALATLGTDTGGSIRLPASLTGVVGLRPTRGRVSNRGSIPVAWSFDAIGPLARRAQDVAAVLEVIAGYDAADPVCEAVPVDGYVAALQRSPEGLRLGVLEGSFRGDPLTAPTESALDAATEVLAGLGLTITSVALDGHLEAIEVTADLLLAEAAAFHADRLAQHPEGFAPDVQTRLRRGQALSGSDYGAGRQHQRRWRRRVLEALEEHDVLLAPACPFPAPRIADSDPLLMTAQLSHFTSVWVLAGVPAVVVPVGFVDRMPVAMQLVGRPFEEANLLRVAHAYQQVTDWHLRRPELAVS